MHFLTKVSRKTKIERKGIIRNKLTAPSFCNFVLRWSFCLILSWLAANKERKVAFDYPSLTGNSPSPQKHAFKFMIRTCLDRLGFWVTAVGARRASKKFLVQEKTPWEKDISSGLGITKKNTCPCGVRGSLL